MNFFDFFNFKNYNLNKKVYIVAIEQDQTEKESLLTLVQPELNKLSQHWSMVLKDFALLSVPNG
jgi:hypothetical protein